MASNAIRAGKAYVEITTKNGSFDKGVAAVQKSLKGVAHIAGNVGKATASGLTRAQGALTSFSGSILNLKSAIVGSVAVTGLTALSKQFAETGTEVMKLRMKFGMAGEAYDKFNFLIDGQVVNGADAKAATRLNMAIKWLGIAMSSVKNLIAASFAPMLTDIAQRITRVVGSLRTWVDANRGYLEIAAQVAAGIAIAGGALLALAGTAAIVSAAISFLTGTVAALGAAFTFAAGIVGAILSPIGLVIGAVVVLGGAILYYTGAGSAALNWLGGQFQWLLETVMPVFEAIKTALMSGQFGAAAKVLMQSLEIAFRSGTKTLYSLWVDSTTRMLNVWTDMWGYMKEGANAAINWITGVWDSTVTWMAKKMLDMYGMITKYIPFMEDFDSNSATKSLDDDLNKRASKRTSDLSADREAREKTKADRLSQAEQSKSEFGGRITQLQKELAQSIKEIQSEAKRQDAAAAKQPNAPVIPNLIDLNAMMLSAVGTSSGFAADRLGAGRDATGFGLLAKELRKNTEETKKTNQILANRGEDQGSNALTLGE